MNWKDGGQRELPEPGSHLARLFKMIDLGTQPSTFNGETKLARKVILTWELPLHLMRGVYDPKVKGLPFAVSKRYTQSLHPKSRLRLDLEGWRGKKMSANDILTFVPKNMLGKCCQLHLVQNETGEFVNISAIMPVGKDQKKITAINPTLYFSLEPEEFDSETFGKLSPKMQEIIAASPEYQKIVGSVPDHSDEDDNIPDGESSTLEPF